MSGGAPGGQRRAAAGTPRCGLKGEHRRGGGTSRFLGCLAVLGVVAVMSPSPAAAYNQQPGDNVAVVDNSDSASPRVTASTVTSDNYGPRVENGNVAVARSHDCTGCRTVAVAVQMLLVEGATTYFAPQNGAGAVNVRCVRCQTFAYAFQYVVDPGHPVQLSDAGQGQVTRIERQIASVARSSASFPEMRAQLDQLTSELAGVVSGDLQSAGRSTRDARESD